MKRPPNACCATDVMRLYDIPALLCFRDRCAAYLFLRRSMPIGEGFSA